MSGTLSLAVGLKTTVYEATEAKQVDFKPCLIWEEVFHPVKTPEKLHGSEQ